MQPEKKKSKAVMEIILTYLAVSKILYWVDVVMYAGIGNWLDVLHNVINRGLTRDFPIIIVVILFHFIEKYVMKKARGGKAYKIALMHFICCIALFASTYLYLWVLSFFFEIIFPPVLMLAPNMLIGYGVAAVVLELKDKFKKKQIEEHMNDNLVLCEKLRKEGVLTEEEYEAKKAMLEQQ